MKSKAFSTSFVVYFLLLVCCCVLFAENHTRFSTAKGQVYVYYLGLLLAVTYFFFLLLHFGIAAIQLAKVLFAPILVLVLGVASSVAVELLKNMEGTTKQSLYLLTATHVVASFLFVKLFWKKQLYKVVVPAVNHPALKEFFL